MNGFEAGPIVGKDRPPLECRNGEPVRPALALRIQCNKVVRALARASQGAFTTQTVSIRCL